MSETEDVGMTGFTGERRVLIVDDDTDFAEGLADILELRGYGYLLAHDPDQAIDLVRKEKPSVGLLDIRLGNNDGIDLLSRMKKQRPEMLCIMITAHAALETAINAIQHGAYDYLRKPIEIHDLMATLDRCFEKLWLQREKEAAETALKERNRELEEMNRRLVSEKEKFRILVEEAPICISIFDKNNRLQYTNPKHRSVFGYGMEECPTMEDMLASLFPDPEYRKYVTADKDWKRLSAGQTVSKTFNTTSKDGTVKSILFRAMPLRSGNSMLLAEDISRQVQLEEQIAQAQKMEAVGTLAGGIAHDFNNLLQAIQGYSQLLLLEKTDNDADKHKLTEIVNASRRASELTRQLLTFSRKVESELRPVNINHVIQQASNLLKRTIPKMIHIDLRLAKNLDVINADPVQLEQVLMNMAINARDAMPDGGLLVFSTANVLFTEEYCRSHLGAHPGPHVEVLISDTGQGLDKETMEHIFEPFFTTKGAGKGTGLGLSMAYGIIKNHKGHIQCISQPGAGTTFKIHLPAIESTVAEENEIADELQPSIGTETILLVDDEPLLREIGTAILTKFGYKVLTSPDGESALEIYQNKQSEIALIVIDLIMPGMGGKRCLQEIIKMDPDAKIVIASGYAGDQESPEYAVAAIKGFIGKPYDVNEMLRVIREILD